MRQVSEIQRDTLYLSVLELPWEEARTRVRDEMARLDMSIEDLFLAIRLKGYVVSRNTLGRVLRGEREPKFGVLREIVGALAENSPTGRYLSSPELTYDFRPSPALGEAGGHGAHSSVPERGLSSRHPQVGPKDLGDIPHLEDVNELSLVGAAL